MSRHPSSPEEQSRQDPSQSDQSKTEEQSTPNQAPAESPETAGSPEPKEKLDSVRVDMTYEELGRGIAFIGGVRPPRKRGT